VAIPLPARWRDDRLTGQASGDVLSHDRRQKCPSQISRISPFSPIPPIFGRVLIPPAVFEEIHQTSGCTAEVPGSYAAQMCRSLAPRRFTQTKERIAEQDEGLVGIASARSLCRVCRYTPVRRLPHDKAPRSQLTSPRSPATPGPGKLFLPFQKKEIVCAGSSCRQSPEWPVQSCTQRRYDLDGAMRQGFSFGPGPNSPATGEHALMVLPSPMTNSVASERETSLPRK